MWQPNDDRVQEIIDAFAHEIGLTQQWQNVISTAGLAATACIQWRSMTTASVGSVTLFSSHKPAFDVIDMVFQAPPFDLSNDRWALHVQNIGTQLWAVGCTQLSNEFMEVAMGRSAPHHVFWPMLARTIAQITAPEGLTMTGSIDDPTWAPQPDKLQAWLTDPTVMTQAKRVVRPWRSFDAKMDSDNLRAFYALVKLGRIEKALDFVR